MSPEQISGRPRSSFTLYPGCTGCRQNKSAAQGLAKSRRLTAFLFVNVKHPIK